MRLDFNVLWVDDQPDRIASQITSIKRQMEAEGFHFNPALCQTLDQVRTHVGNGIFADEIDLVLVDWDLGGGVHGEDAIKVVRDEVRYKDVVFYSAMKPANELRALASSNELEGVFCAAREFLVDEVMGVFDSLIKKVLDLDHSRGIVMGATSDIDHLVNETLSLMHGKLDGNGQAALLKDILKRIDERLADLTKRIGKLKDADFAAVFTSHEVFTANDRLRMLSAMLKKDQFKAFAETRAGIVAYLEEVVPGRTMLAHLVLVPEGRPEAIIDTAGKTVTLEETRTMRRRMLSMRNDFRGLVDSLKGE
ncbi:hypothetical protein [Bradyrhizobium lupini]